VQAASKIAGQSEINIFIQNGERVFMPCVFEGITWETERKGSPGKLSFKVLGDDALELDEGNIVKMTSGGSEIFKGYIFTLRQDKDNAVSITCYDQLRYLKNKDIYEFVNIKASDVIKRIADDFKLEVGEIADTEYVIPKMRASNETLFDIIYTALDHTLIYGKKMFVLYDEAGKIMLKNLEDMTVPILLDAETAENFNYESTIDRETYNKVKLYYDNRETGSREVYMALDSANMARWGTLQMCESINMKQCANPAAKADTLLKTYNKAYKTLTIKSALGDDRVRGGCGIYVQLNAGNMEIGKPANGESVLMLVESVKHKYDNGSHTMDLRLRGNGIT
jgi:hypothetical protein